MPIYEYRCTRCRRRTTVLVRSIFNPPQPVCQHCGSPNPTRLISKVSFHHSWGDSLDRIPDSGFPGDLDENDPRQMAQWMRRLQKETGEEGSPKFDEMLEEMESGVEEPEDDAE